MHRRVTIGDKVFNFTNYTILVFVLLITLYPVLYVLIASLSSPEAINGGKVWLYPVEFTLMGYEAVFRNDMIITGYLNSFFYMITGTVLNLIMTTLAAYPLSRNKLPGKKIILFLFTFTMFFGGGLIPFYLLVRDLGLIYTRWALIIPSAMSVWNVLIMRTYFQTNIPGELYESAQMDGCRDFKFLVRIVIPLSGPIIAVLSLFTAVGFWNAYFNALIFINNKDLYPLQLVLRNILIMNTVTIEMLSRDPNGLQAKLQIIDVLKYSAIVIASLPLIIVYPFVQRFFVKGIMIGSLKG